MTLAGVTASTGRVPEAYLAALRGAGLEAVVLANDSSAVERDLDGVDGIVVTGGADVDPARYGAARHPATEPGAPDRDLYELALVRRARERGVPTLCICRGAQIANVAFGGTLVQHVPDLAGDALPHAPLDAGGTALRGVAAAHVVDVAPESRLAAILGLTRLATSARHHQSVGAVAPGLRVVGRTADGIVEALEPERTEGAFWLAVQWHPETTLDDGGPSARIFAAFAAACAGAGAAGCVR